ncbi:BQ2448_5140 [Microbotryum intermedium]|uniref:25S rRNA adenine-N(1) methyltransferase n=1 Tax=Microbotryum intermedium TaxID=269621 RepID=A0A238F498_9BASI|nr:BQ2448_5140 [Microbotryum intermedium]
MPHTNNPNAASRNVNRAGKKPKFLQKKSGSAVARQRHGTIDEAKSAKDELNEKDMDLNRPKAKSKSKSKGKGKNQDQEQGQNQGRTSALVAPAEQDSESRESKMQLIREFHAIEKRLAVTQDPTKRAGLIARQEELGGLQKYQDASVHGGDKSRGGETSKWCVTQLKELKVGLDKGKQKEEAKVEPVINPDGTKTWPKIEREKLRLLDVGAIAGTAYADYAWIETTSIDLNPQSKSVLKYDFFDYPPPSPSGRFFDVVALSLVLNFEGSLTRRADMLRRAHLYLKPQGLLFLVLPLPCLTNSRYMNHARLESILLTTGWAPVKKKDSAKLTYWLCKRVGDGSGDGKSWRREQLRGGIQRNNFAIIVSAPDQSSMEEHDASTSALAATSTTPVVAPAAAAAAAAAPAIDKPRAPAEAAEVDEDYEITTTEATLHEAEEEEWGGIKMKLEAIEPVSVEVEAQDDAEVEWAGIED